VKCRREWSEKKWWQALRHEFEMIRKVPYHPNVAWLVGVHFGEEPFVVEELMPKSLHQVLHGGDPPLTYFDILRVCLDVTKGMNHLHKHGVTHCAIKPSNVLMYRELQNVKLADFMTSRLKWAATITPFVCYSLGYCAPELLAEGVRPLQQAGHDPGATASNQSVDVYSTRSVDVYSAQPADVYSLGMVMLVCVTGGLDSSHPRAKAQCPQGLWRLIQQCVRQDPGDRPKGEKIVQVLDEMLSGRPAGADWRLRKPREEIWSS